MYLVIFYLIAIVSCLVSNNSNSLRFLGIFGSRSTSGILTWLIYRSCGPRDSSKLVSQIKKCTWWHQPWWEEVEGLCCVPNFCAMNGGEREFGVQRLERSHPETEKRKLIYISDSLYTLHITQSLSYSPILLNILFSSFLIIIYACLTIPNAVIELKTRVLHSILIYSFRRYAIRCSKFR